MSIDIFCLPPPVFFLGLLALLLLMFLCFKGISAWMRMYSIRKVPVLHVRLNKPVVLEWVDKPPPYDFPPGYKEAIFGNRNSRPRVMVIATEVHKKPQNSRR